MLLLSFQDCNLWIHSVVYTAVLRDTIANILFELKYNKEPMSFFYGENMFRL